MEEKGCGKGWVYVYVYSASCKKVFGKTLKTWGKRIWNHSTGKIARVIELSQILGPRCENPWCFVRQRKNLTLAKFLTRRRHLDQENWLGGFNELACYIYCMSFHIYCSGLAYDLIREAWFGARLSRSLSLFRDSKASASWRARPSAARMPIACTDRQVYRQTDR